MNQVARSLTAAAELYSTELTEQQIEGYLAALQPWHPADIVTALSIAVKECSYFPKIAEIVTRIPTKRPDHFVDEPPLDDREQALGRDLIELFIDHLNGKTTCAEWRAQMLYFADKHGLKSRMESAIRQEGI